LKAIDGRLSVSGETIMDFAELDHGLPLIALKEQRRDLIMSLRGERGPLPAGVIQEISALQAAIAAIEAVIADLDDELIPFHTSPAPRQIFS
jgi:hypothetical protein